MIWRKKLSSGKSLEWNDLECPSGLGEKLAVSVSRGDYVATVVMFPGFTSKRKNTTNLELARFLTPLGVRCLVADLSGHGDSTGQIEDQTISKAADEISSILGLVEREFAGPIGLLGNSFSGTAAIVACSRASRVGALGLKSPILDYVTMRREQLGEVAMEAWARDGIIELPGGTPSRYSFIEDAQHLAVAQSLASLAIPVMAVHGGWDEQIPREQIEFWSERFSSDGREHAILESGNHGLDGRFFAPMARLLQAFFADTLLQRTE